MSRLEIRSLGPVSTGYIDGSAIGLRTFVEGEYFQYFTGMITTLQQVTVLRAITADDEALMWRALGAVAARSVIAAVKSSYATGTLPTTHPTTAVELHLDPYEVRRAMDEPNTLPASVARGELIGHAEL